MYFFVTIYPSVQKSVHLLPVSKTKMQAISSLQDIWTYLQIGRIIKALVAIRADIWPLASVPSHMRP